MEYRSDGQNWLMRLEKGELLVENLTQLIENEKIVAAWIGGLGAAAWVELGYYDLGEQTYHWKKFGELMEITAIQGNIAWDGSKPVIHMHGTFSGHDMQAVGGHIRELEAGGTVEIFIRGFGKEKIMRVHDTETGLKLLGL